jgi:cyclopropane fatty-acyl-phospholipid synthase-like methyltransferase
MTYSCARVLSPEETLEEARHNKLREMGFHYIRTLQEWKNRFLGQTQPLEAMGLESAFRWKWVYYIAYFEAGFATGAAGNLQIVLRREPGR